MRKLVAIDPGLKTGMITLNIDDPKNPTTLLTWELGFEAFQYAFDSFLHFEHSGNPESDQAEVVIENFIITPATAKLTQAPWSLKHIGVVEYLCRKYKAELTLQTPSTSKTFVPDARLKALGLWTPGGGGHARDATRHAVLYLVEKYKWQPEGLLVEDDS